MNNQHLLLVLAMLATACGSTPAPEWQQSGNIRLDRLIDSHMAGKVRSADLYYERLMVSLAETGDPDIMIRGPLTLCAMNKALLQPAQCSEAAPYVPMVLDPETLVYFSFVSSARPIEGKIPEKYLAISEATQPCQADRATACVQKQEDSLSRLIAVSVAVSNDCVSEEMLELAVSTASAQGWTRAVAIYLERLLEYYTKHARATEAERVKRRLELVQARK